MNEIAIKIPPHDIEAEQAILCSMLMDRDAIITAHEHLKKDDFYRADHQAIYSAMIELFLKNTPVDMITLKDKLTDQGIYENIGGFSYITSLATATSTSAHIKYYIDIITKKSTLRNLITLSNEIGELSYSGREDIDTILDKAEKGVFSIVRNRDTEDFSHISDILVNSLEKIEQIYMSKETITGVPTGFIDLDYKTAGLQKSDFILIAARPSMGKTAFALNIAQHVAVRKHIPTAIFSLEMSKEQLINRLLCAEAAIDAQKLRTGSLQDQDWTAIVQAIGPLSDAPMYIDDTPSISIAELRAKCRKLKLEKNLGLVMIDYLQLMTAGHKVESRQQEISEISRSLKALARELDAPVIALSQLSRACEARSDRRPMLSDLRDSGAIEQDADLVAFLYRDEYYHPETEKKNQAEVIIAKQRNGPTGTVDLAWLSQFTKFTNLALHV